MLWVVLGAVAAAIALGGVGYAILRLGKQLPLKPMLDHRRRRSCCCCRSPSPATPCARCRRPTSLAATPVDSAAPAGVPGRADRHPPDARGPDRAGASLLGGLRRSAPLYVFALAGPRAARREPRRRSARRHDAASASASTSAAPSRRRSRVTAHPLALRAHAVVPTTPRRRGRGDRRASPRRCARCSPSSATSATGSSSSPSRRRRR